MMKAKRFLTRILLITCLVIAVAGSVGLVLAQRPEPQGEMSVQASPVGTGFTYQGQLTTGSRLVNATCNMAFRLYDDPGAGSQVGNVITTTVPVTNGRFTVNLDFGAGAFTGQARWLGIRVQCPGDVSYADLGRQALTATPYALNADLLDGKDSTQFAAAAHTHSGTLVNSYRVQVFGHAKHDVFYTTSTSYVEVPDTFAAQYGQFPDPAPGAQRWYRLEVSFAVNHNRVIYLRMRDPWNNQIAWEYSFQGGDASNTWWSWGTTPRFSIWRAWNRQHDLEMKASDTTGAYLGSVWIVAEDVMP